MKKNNLLFKAAAMAMTAIMAFSLTACGGGSQSAPAAAPAPEAKEEATPAEAPAAEADAAEAPAATGEPKKMVLIGSASGGTFWGPIEQTFKEQLASIGWEGEYWAPASPSDAGNLELCDTALVQGYDVIAAVMNDIVIFEDFLNRANEAGITVLAFNCSPGEDVVPAMVGIDQYASGYQQGEKIAEVANERGLEAIKYYCTCTNVSHQPQMNTKRGVLDAIAANYDGEVIEYGMVEVKDNAATGEDGMAQLYINYDDVNTIFCLESTGAVAAGAFIESKGLQGQVIAMGLALNDEAFERVRNQSWTATSMVDVEWMGRQIVDVANAVVNGGEFTYDNFPDKVWVTNEEEIEAYKAAHPAS